MAFDWARYLVLAEELATRPDDEAKRTAISRAYYAIYCIARDRYVVERGPVPLGVNSHAEIWNWYRQSRDRTRGFIGRDGQRMLGFRVMADYDADYDDLIADTGRAVLIARKALANLSKL